MALVGIELETLVSEPDALTTRPPPFRELLVVFALIFFYCCFCSLFAYEKISLSCKTIFVILYISLKPLVGAQESTS